jgi:PAS domain S-box-containing protein
MAEYRVLYVDDEPELLELGRLFLEQGGHFRVDTISSARDALSLLTSTKYDAIVSDYLMPEMDGIEFLKNVRERGDHIPFILFTGRGREEVVIQAINEGADFYLQKGGAPTPQFTELSHKILQAIQKRMAEVKVSESQAQLREIVDSIQIGILIVDAATHRILNANKKAIGMIGADPGEIIGSLCHQFICPAEYGSCPVTDLGQTIDLSERILLNRNGEKLPVLKSVVRTAVEGRQVLIESFFDLSEQKRSEGAFQTLIRSMVGGTGLASLDTITTNVSRWLGTDIAMVQEITRDLQYGRILSLQPGSGTLSGDLRPLKGTPCGVAAEKGYYLCPDNLRTLFPESQTPLDFIPRSYVGTALRNSEGRVIGTLCAFSRNPLTAPPQMQGILEIIGVKAAAEIERKQAEEEIRQKNFHLSTVNELEREFAELPTGSRVEILAAKKLLALSGAVVTVFSTYDPVRQVLNVAALELGPGILDGLPGGWEKVSGWLGQRPEQMEIPLRKEMYLDIRRSIVGMKKTVSEISYGYISPVVSASIQTLSGIERFIHIAHVIDGELYGTSVIGLRAERPDPSMEILESFAHIIAVSLRRQRAELALRESDERLRQITENITTVFYIYDRALGRFLYVSQAYESVWMKSCQSLLDDPKSYLESIHPDDLPRVAESIRRDLEENIFVDIEYRILLPDGGVRWIHARNFPVVDGKGSVYRVAGLAEDITELKTSRSALEESEEKFRSLVGYALEAVLILDFSGIVLLANNATARLVETDDAAGLFGRNVMEFIAPESREAVMKDFAEVARGHDAFLAQYNVISAKGKRIVVECIGKAVTFEGRPADLISLYDITDRKRTEEALRQVNKKLNLLSSMTRHDILNQILIVNAYSALTERASTDQNVLEFLAKIKTAAGKIQSTILFTRDYEQLGQNDPVWQDVGKVAQAAAVDLLPESLMLTVDEGTPEVFADPMLMLVFYNLFENVIRHGVHATRIYVHFIPDGAEGTLFVEDNGIGIPQKNKEYIFERGFGANTGLGLYLIREILAITGLSITETGTEGEGTRFEIRLPPGSWRRH